VSRRIQSNRLYKINGRGKLMSLETYKSLLDQAGQYRYRIQFYDNGEPFTNRRLLEIVSLAAERKIGSQASTNFSFAFQDHVYSDIIDSRLEHLIVASALSKIVALKATIA
jgi:hypothetical protein